MLPASSSDSLDYCRLTVDHAAEIVPLVNRVWNAAYGAAGRPVFHKDYLEWLYGGPDREEHCLVGVRLRGKLIALKALLFRPAQYRGTELRANLCTHLTIDPDLPVAHRLAIAVELGKAHALTGEFPFGSFDPRDASICFYEANKTLAHSTTKSLRKSGFRTSPIQFQQSIVNPVKLRAALNEPGGPRGRVREGQQDDAHLLADLLRHAGPRSPFRLRLSARRLRHHVFRAPGARVFLHERGGALRGFVACYLLRTRKQDHETSVVVVELLIADRTPGAMRGLLGSAVSYAKAAGAKGVVIENPTYLDPERCHRVGVVASPRRMIMAVRTRSDEMEFDGSFVMDVK